jgi:hypothetical protein
MGFRIDRSVRHHTLCAIFLVPHTAVGQQNRTVEGDRPAMSAGPELKDKS